MKWLLLLVLTLVIAAIVLVFYGATFFLNVALDRQSKWYQNKGHQLMNPDNFKKAPTKYSQIESRQQSEGRTFWESEFAEDHWLQVNQTKLYARLFHPFPESSRWVICVHGYRSTGKRDMSYIALRFAEEGYNVLVPDLRAHGKSSGETIGMGWLDRLDLLRWISYVISLNDQAEIVLMGGSMGAATVMMTSGEKLPYNVKALIADCGYTSAYDECQALLRSALQLPAWPILPLANYLARKKAGYTLKAASAVAQLKKNDLPALFIHGTGDQFVPYEMLKENVAASQGLKESLTVPGAPHFSSSIYEPERYFGTIFEFITRYTHIR
ncbi:alpha/beta hydrolase [Enterococcus faecalis]